ncbi:MAG: glutamine amidotransferase [Verrucomicrobiota bacterium]
MMADSIYFAAEEGAWLAAAFVLFSVILLWQSYRHYPVSGWPRWLAMLLKLSVLLLLALCLMEPMWSGTSPKKGANDFVVLADNSKRYAVENRKGVKVGLGLESLLKVGEGGGGSEFLRQVASNFRLRTYQLDRVLKRVGDFEHLDFSSTEGKLISALDGLQDRFEGRALAGMLVFSDGNVADGELLQAFEKRWGGAPVFPVIIKSGETLRDLSLRSVEVKQSTFEDAPVTLTAGVSAQGLEGEQVKVVVTDGEGKKVVTELRRLGAKGQEQIRLQVPTSKAGISFYSVELSLVEGNKDKTAHKEATLGNNVRLVAVDRKRGPYRILYVSGRPNWDYKFMRRAVIRDAEIDLVGLVRAARREPKFEWRGRTGETSNPLFRGFNSDVPEESRRYDQPVLVRLNTRDEDELREGFPKTDEALMGEYRAIILDDVEADFFTQEQMNLVERFVSNRGGALLMLGGAESFREGAYTKTPIGQMLPVYLDRLDVGEGGKALKDARFSLTREGWLEPWMRLRKQQEQEDARLAFMPAFHAANRVSAIKPGASLLAVLSDDEERRYPALVTQRYGLGRTAAYLLADVWRWGMKDPDLREDMEKSWRQLLRWLVVDTPDLIEFSQRQKSVEEGGGVDFSVQVRDKAFRGDTEVAVKIEVSHGRQGEEKVAELFAEVDLEQEGYFAANFYPREQGAYRAKLRVNGKRGESLGEREVAWVRNSNADELSRLSPDRAVLERLAAATGGRVLELDEVMAFVKDELPLMQTPVTETWSRPLWHAPWFFMAALLLLLGEWALRRWKGVI